MKVKVYHLEESMETETEYTSSLSKMTKLKNEFHTI